MRFPLRLPALVLLALLSSPAAAQDHDPPYWASLRADEVNMRAGPSEDYQIEWVYRRKSLPVKVVRIMEGWRLVRDPDGAQGWVVARLLNPARTALVTGKGLAAIRDAPADNGRLLWNVEPGVVGKLGDCETGWCEFDAGNGRKGWIRQARLWGAGDP